MTAVRHRLRVTGVVQGVGFRPFVHRLARESGLVGFVRNDTGYVHIEVEGPPASVERFEHRLRVDAPPLARVDDVTSATVDRRDDAEFSIAASAAAEGAAIVVPPDVAVCPDCRRELFDPTDRRFRHPFITCTNCGPRFTIVPAMPYDPPNTTMAGFPMCDRCRTEYHDPTDRRHHAQPLACPDCGPTLSYESRDGHKMLRDRSSDSVMWQVQEDLGAGWIVAVKGLGGYHLAADATDEEAVMRLRERKGRGGKPFAVMVPDVETAGRLAHISPTELEALDSAANPIVLLRARPSEVAAAVAPGSSLIGLMLPSTPLHHLLFAPVPGRPGPVPSALVMTSGNLSEEPICTDDADAQRRLGAMADSFCSHDRPIHAPCDDSVVRVVDEQVMPIRRSRGYAPLPIRLPGRTTPSLAVGGDLKNTFAVARGETAWLSQHLGDMGHRETLDAFETAVELFTGACRVEPRRLIADTHPGYHTHRWALQNTADAEFVTVQHHHAHLAALMAEHGIVDGRPILGFVFDGTGLGLDGGSWGGEILLGGYTGFERWGHLGEVRLPGGDSAPSNPCRSALAHLRAAGIAWADDLAPVAATSTDERTVLASQLGSDRLSIDSTSMGRLFDAVASLLGLRHRIVYEAEAAAELEVLATEATDTHPVPLFLDPSGCIDPTPAIRATVAARRAGTDPAALARGFHEGLASVMLDAARRVREERGIGAVGLSGGVFQNALLTELVARQLRTDDFDVLIHRLVPPNDGGIALGQVMISAATAGSSPCA